MRIIVGSAAFILLAGPACSVAAAEPIAPLPEAAIAVDLDGDGQPSPEETLLLELWLEMGGSAGELTQAAAETGQAAAGYTLGVAEDRQLAAPLGGPRNSDEPIVFSSVVYCQLRSPCTPHTAAAGDFDKDGYPDLVATETAYETIAVFRNERNRTFAPAVRYKVGPADSQSGPVDVAVADFNRDEWLDLAILNRKLKTVKILWNNGKNLTDPHASFSGLFKPDDPAFSQEIALVGEKVPGPSEPRTIRAADLNGDGRCDLAIGVYGDTDGLVSVIPQQADGRFQNGDVRVYDDSISGGDRQQTSFICVGAMGGDNLPDIVSCGGLVGVNVSRAVPPPFDWEQAFDWSERDPGDTEGIVPCQVALGELADLDGDGDNDMATPGMLNAYLFFLDNWGETPARFSETSSLLLGDPQTTCGWGACSVDLDGDSDLDLIVAEQTASPARFRVLRNSGSRDPGMMLSDVFPLSQSQEYDLYAGGVAASPHMAAAADLNGDGKKDLIFPLWNDKVAVLFNETVWPTVPFRRGDPNDDGAINIADPISILGYLFRYALPPKCIASADANSDGRIDIADAVYLLGYLFSSGSPPGVPFPGCGDGPFFGLSCVRYDHCN